MRTKTKIIILAMLEGEKTCWTVKSMLLTAYFQSQNQDKAVKYAIANHYAQLITNEIKKNTDENLEDVSEELVNFFHQSILYRKMPTDFFCKILRDSKLHDFAVSLFIKMSFYLGRASFDTMLKGMPDRIIQQAQKVHADSQSQLFEYVKKNPKIFNLASSPEYFRRARNGFIGLFIITVIICNIVEVSLASTILYSVSAAIAGFVFANHHWVIKSSRDSVINNMHLSLRIRHDNYHDKDPVAEDKQNVVSESIKANQNNIDVKIEPQVVLILEEGNKEQTTLLDNSSNSHATAMPILKRKHKTNNLITPAEEGNLKTEVINQPLMPSHFGEQYEYLKSKHIAKVEGKGAGLGPNSNLFLIWHRRSIKEKIKLRDRANYVGLKKTFLEVGTAAPRGDFGLKYIPEFEIFELKGRGKARVHSDDKGIKKDNKSAVVLTHYSRYGFH